MSISAPNGSPAAPVVNQALEPKWVRDGSASTQKAYQSALAFEQTLVEQLSKSLTAASGLSGESSGEGSTGAEEEGASQAGGAVGSELASLLPQSLSSGVMDAGGLGLAAQLTRGLQGTSAAAQSQPTGGTGAA